MSEEKPVDEDKSTDDLIASKTKFDEKLYKASKTIVGILDKDGSGELNAVEVKRLLKITFKYMKKKKIHKKVSDKDKSHIRNIMEKCLDKDKDGKISKEELAQKEQARECL